MKYVNEVSKLFKGRANRYLESPNLRKFVNQSMDYVTNKRRDFPNSDFIRFEKSENMGKFLRMLYLHKEYAFKKNMSHRYKLKKTYKALERCN